MGQKPLLLLPPPSPVFFIDRSLGRKDVAGVLKARGACVQLHDQHFNQNEKDEKWIADVAQKGWVILTKDTEHHRKDTEREAIAQSGAREFALSNASISGVEMGQIFASALPSILRYLNRHQGPFIVRVHRNLNLVRIYP